MKNAFYFTLKALLVLKIIKFLYRLFAHVKNDLIRKIRLISEFMTSKPGYQTIETQILNNISRSKAKQAMKFGQLIEYNMRNIFREKSYAKCVRETISRSFSSLISKLSMSLDQQSKVLYKFVFIVCKVADYRKIFKLRCRAFAFPSYKTFKKKLLPYSLHN